MVLHGHFSARSGAFVFVLAFSLVLLAGCGGEDCYSPTENLDTAYEDGAIGCSCDPAADEDVCVEDSTGRNVALMCDEGRWLAVEDGACMPTPDGLGR